MTLPPNSVQAACLLRLTIQVLLQHAALKDAPDVVATLLESGTARAFDRDATARLLCGIGSDGCTALHR